MPDSRPRAARTVALAAGAGLLTSTIACLTAGSATAAEPTQLGYYVSSLAALPDGGAIAVGNSWDEESGTGSPHASRIVDGTATSVTGLPASANLQAVAVADGRVLVGGSDDDGAQAWSVDAAGAATAVGAPDAGWSEISAMAAAGSTVALAGTAYDDDGNETVVSWSTSGRTVLAQNGHANAMTTDVADGTVTSFVVGDDYDTGSGTLWVADGGEPAAAYPVGDWPTAVVESSDVVYVADSAADGDEIRAVDATDGHVVGTVSFADAGSVTGLAIGPDGKTLFATAGAAVYAIPLDHFSGFDPDAGDDVLYADDGLYGLALSQTGGHLSAYSAVYSSSGDGHDVVHLTAPATPTLTAVVDADDPTSLSITVPGSWSQDHYTLHVTAGGHDVAATATDCDEDWEAKTSTCTVGSLERGVTYGISVSASNVFGSATSDVTTIRTPGVLAGPSTVSFTGTAQVGATLTAAVGTGWPAGTTFTYAWGWGTGRMGGLAATTPTFKVPASLAGTYLTLIVTGRQGTDYREVRSAAVLVKAAAPQVLPALPTTAKATPKVAGKAKVGKKLRASVGTWPAGTTLHYQWYANGKVVKGATRTTLKVTRKLKGKKVSVRVTGTKPGYAAVTRASKPVRVS